jgi:hypothetical protein
MPYLDGMGSVIKVGGGQDTVFGGGGFCGHGDAVNCIGCMPTAPYLNGSGANIKMCDGV